MLLIFDCDGVITDSMVLHNQIEEDFYAAAGVKITAADLGRRFAGVARSEISEILEKEHGVKLPADFEDKMHDHKAEIFSKELRPIDGVRDALAALADTPKCVASGTVSPLLRHSLRVTGLFDVFAPHIFSTDQVKRGKPAPDLFLFAAAQVGAEPADCVVVEDGTAGVIGARAAGMRAWGFTGGSHTDAGHADRLRAAGAERIFAHMDELSALVRA